MLRRLLVVALALAGLTVLPAASSAGPVDAVVRSAVLSLGTTTAGLSSERLVGVTWHSGSATVRYRWHTPAGWTAWQTADQDGSDEGTPGTEPLWRPAKADLAQLTVSGNATGLRLARVSDGHARLRLGLQQAHAAVAHGILGTVQTRADWGADESWVRRSPSYASKVVAVTVHHTDNQNGYTPDEVPSLIRADYAYHVKTRGWADLGYNLLVDEYGRVWEGRRGGLGRATIGSHAQGFNTGTVGVAMLGDMTKTHASEAADRALARVVAYAATTWHFDPRTTVRLTSRGSPRYRSGTTVTLHRVFGHGETGITDCPGSLQQDLPRIRDLAWTAMTAPPSILSTQLSGAPLHSPTPVLLDARLSRDVPWELFFKDSNGYVVASATGTSDHPHLGWDGSRDGLPALPGSYTWTLRADDGFHDPVTRSGTFDAGLPDATHLI
ncbi:MAG: repeat protein [Frankiales bacterium]|nr:repeat protein [Frankiales bacterium]